MRASLRYLTGPRAARILGAETSMRILVVDDDPSVAEVIAEAIRARGDAALVALDGAEALDLLETTPVDGVFLDLVMPGLGGIATLARVRTRHPDLPVVILSGHADEEQAREALSLGAVDVIKETGCADPSQRSSSRVSNASEFRLEYRLIGWHSSNLCEPVWEKQCPFPPIGLQDRTGCLETQKVAVL